MDRASDISIERLFWLRGVPSFAGGLVCGDCRRRSNGIKQLCERVM